MREIRASVQDRAFLSFPGIVRLQILYGRAPFYRFERVCEAIAGAVVPHL